MDDERNSFSPPEDEAIDVKDAWQVLWWCRVLNVTKTQLEEAVEAVGREPKDVKHYLFQHH